MRHTPGFPVRRAVGAVFALILVAASSHPAQAQGLRARRVRVVPTSAPRVAGVAPSPMLGSFYPEPYINLRGNFEAGGGYSPLGIYGDASATMYGPLSTFRDASAPVLTYQRGYDGSFRQEIGTGFSTPNQPATSRIVYPTRANVTGAPRRVLSPPSWDSGINWIDLN